MNEKQHHSTLLKIEAGIIKAREGKKYTLEISTSDLAWLTDSLRKAAVAATQAHESYENLKGATGHLAAYRSKSITGEALFNNLTHDMQNKRSVGRSARVLKFLNIYKEEVV